jgi:single-strand DNA-binding protein
MSVNINRITLIGNVTKGIEVQYTKNSTPVANFTLVTNRNYKIEKNGQTEWQSIPEFHNVVFYGKVAEVIAERITKGSRIYVDGRMTYDKWTDRDGNQKITAKVLGNNFVILDKKDVQKSEEISDDQIEKELKKIKKEKPPKKEDMDENVEPEEIPF